MVNEYKQFQEYIEDKDYSSAAKTLAKNPDLRYSFSKDELIIMLDFYENSLRKVLKNVGEMGEDISQLKQGIEKVI